MIKCRQRAGYIPPRIILKRRTVMKKIRYIFALLLVIALAVSMAGCYIISAQTMNKLKGTYKLTRYTYTPNYERREGYTPTTYDYVNDEKYKYEDYLVITGGATGYYVHKDASGDCYVKEVTLTYEYAEDNASKVEYIVYNDSITVNSDGGINRMGVNKGNLTYNKTGIDYTEIFTKRPMRTEALSVSWTKVDNATDLSYAQSQIAGLKSYSYSAFALRGIYEMSWQRNVETSEFLDEKYLYYYVTVDTADGVTTATVCYALKETPTEQVKKTVSYSASEDFAKLTIDGDVWERATNGTSTYTNVKDGIESELRHVTFDMSEGSLESLVKERLPVEEESNA